MRSLLNARAALPPVEEITAVDPLLLCYIHEPHLCHKDGKISCYCLHVCLCVRGDERGCACALHVEGSTCVWVYVGVHLKMLWCVYIKCIMCKCVYTLALSFSSQELLHHHGMEGGSAVAPAPACNGGTLLLQQLQIDCMHAMHLHRKAMRLLEGDNVPHATILVCLGVGWGRVRLSGYEVYA